MSKSIGIDLGTTFTLASYMNSVGKPELIPNSEGSLLTPSAVWVKGNSVLVGEPALNIAQAEPEYLAVQMKRNMGDASFRFQGLDATEVACHILTKIKRDAETFFRERGEDETVSAAAITVPAYFTDLPTKATRRAGEMAGLEVLALPKEPTAAALFYGTTQMKDGEKTLVWDVGGGTTDGTVLGFSQVGGEAEFSVLASDGSPSLGGEDWTAKLFDMLAPAFEKEFGVSPNSDPGVEQTLLAACESAKRVLSVNETAKVAVSWGGKLFSFPVTRAAFEAATAGLVREAVDKAQGAVEKAGLTWGGLSRVLLVGGATRMGALGRSLKERSGLAPVTWGAPDQLVALGAALYTARRAGSGGGVELVVGASRPSGQPVAGGGVIIRLRESTTHGLGVIVAERGGGRPRLVSSVIIRAGTRVPAQGERSDYRARPHQTEIDVPVVQADQDGLDPSSCVLNKTYRFLGVPDRASESAIRVTFHYDKDSMVDVNAVDIASGKTLEKQLIDFEQPEGGGGLDVLFVLDTSSSMFGQPLTDLKIQVLEVCNELAGKGCRAGVVEFGNRVAVVSPFTDDIDRIRAEVNGLRAGNGTPMAEGLAAAFGLLPEGGEDKVVVLVSDGVPNSQSAAIVEADRIKRLGVKLYTISIGSGGADFLRQIGDGYAQIQSAGDFATAVGKLLWKA